MKNNPSEIEQVGFSVLPDMFSQSEMENLTAEIEQSGLGRSKAGIRHALRNSGVQKLARDPRLLSLAREILDRDAIPFRATLFDKSPHGNWLAVWHQDTALPLRKRHDAQGWGHGQ